jgi:hypothetical protein
MKKLSVTLSAIVFLTSAISFAQTSPLATGSSTYSEANYMKKARIQLEKDNEQKLLEMLEAQRLQEEKNRLERIEGMSFSVSRAPAAPVQQQAIPVQQVNATPSDAYQTF